MWLLQLRNDKVTFLVTPEDHFNGWLYSIQSDTRHGFHAIVLGWHLSAGEAILVYFRFDGKLYRAIGSAKILFDDNDIGKIVPDTAS